MSLNRTFVFNTELPSPRPTPIRWEWENYRTLAPSSTDQLQVTLLDHLNLPVRLIQPRSEFFRDTIRCSLSRRTGENQGEGTSFFCRP